MVYKWNVVFFVIYKAKFRQDIKLNKIGYIGQKTISSGFNLRLVMFSGIVQSVGEIISCDPVSSDSMERKIGIKCNVRASVGESICCSGVCLTVADVDYNKLYFHLGTETISITTIDQWQMGKFINLETSLKVGDPLGGHYVSGHIDCISKILSIDTIGNTVILRISYPETLRGFFPKKGSIAVNGISLTINNSGKDFFEVAIIPHTMESTNLSYISVGDSVNVEIDYLARYLQSLLDLRLTSSKNEY